MIHLHKTNSPAQLQALPNPISSAPDLTHRPGTISDPQSLITFYLDQSPCGREEVMQVATTRPRKIRVSSKLDALSGRFVIYCLLEFDLECR